MESVDWPKMSTEMDGIAKQFNCLPFKVSGKTGENVSAMFMSVVSQIFNESSIKGSEKRDEPITLMRSESKEKSKSKAVCC